MILVKDLDRYLDKMLSKFKNILINLLLQIKFNLDKYLNNYLSKYGIVRDPKIMLLESYLLQLIFCVCCMKAVFPLMNFQLNLIIHPQKTSKGKYFHL